MCCLYFLSVVITSCCLLLLSSCALLNIDIKRFVLQFLINCQQVACCNVKTIRKCCRLSLCAYVCTCIHVLHGATNLPHKRETMIGMYATHVTSPIKFNLCTNSDGDDRPLRVVA